MTGTNGKTTVTQLVRSILDTAGTPTGVVGTLTGERTTPEAPELQALLAGFRDAGRRAVAMEVSSHALTQHRVDGISFDVCAFTNLSHDHLDHHHSMEAYFAAKASLFAPGRCRLAVVNVDDPWGERLAHQIEGIEVVPVRRSDASDIALSVGSSSFRWRSHPVTLPMTGVFNVDNALLAAAVAVRLGVDEEGVVEGLRRAEAPAGRMEVVTAGPPFAVLVDYAHTPAGLGVALASARRLAGDGRVVCLFGCGGDRDPDKRPLMGEVAGRMADVTVLTSDNPRSEDPLAIIDQVRGGVPGDAELVVEPDRRTGHRAGGGPGPSGGRGPAGRQGPRDDPGSGRRRPAVRRPDGGPGGPRDGRGRGDPLISLMTSGGIALWVAVLATPVLIRWLVKHNIGQQIREDGPQVHIAKAGTPTMGGMGIVLAVVVGFLVAHLIPGVHLSRSGVLVMGAILGAGADRLRRRLDQGPPPAQPGPEQAGQVRLADRPRPGLLPAARCTGPTPPPPCRSPGTTRPASRWAPWCGWCGPRSSSRRRPTP